MPETCDKSVRCGQHQVQPQHDNIKHLEGPRPPLPHPPLPPPPPPSPPSTGEVVSPPASGSQCWGNMDGIRLKQQRPSVLRQVSQTVFRREHAHPESSAAISICKEEVDASHLPQSSSPHMGLSPRAGHQYLPLRTDGPKQNAIEARIYDSINEGTSALFVSGLCRWPGCDAVSEDFSSFLKHLHSEHRHGDRSIAQWRVQQDIVQYMESQLSLEKQKLIAMQLHLSEHKYSDLKAASEWSYSLPLFLPQPHVTDGVQQWDIKRMEELVQHGYRAVGSAPTLQDLVTSSECYKYNNIRPPYTYAYLIRWGLQTDFRCITATYEAGVFISVTGVAEIRELGKLRSILESPDKQRTLNEIYNWFTTMFFYFRHNTATWKNAVRHNLSLHKCFVRVEGGKGAVWTVDEREYQRRKGQKYHRDCPVKWLTSCSIYSPEDP